MSVVVVVATMTPLPEHVDAVREALLAAAPQVRRLTALPAGTGGKGAV